MYHDIKKLKEMHEDVLEILSEDDKAKLGYRKLDESAVVDQIHQIDESDIAISGNLVPLMRMQDRKDIKPAQGKESDAEIYFTFEDLSDAQELYDFVLDTGMLEAGEVRLTMESGQNSVHFAPHVIWTKPDVFQAVLMAYDEYVTEDSDEAVDNLTEAVMVALDEKYKVSGAPKKRKKGNPFHDKEGKLSGPKEIDKADGGSFSSGKTKLKFTKAKKAKSGDMVANFASTKRPCGRTAREKGKDIRCWDGSKGAGAAMAKVLKKKLRKEDISDDELRTFIEALDYLDRSVAMMEAERGEERGETPPFQSKDIDLREAQKADPALAMPDDEKKAKPGAFKISQKAIKLFKSGIPEWTLDKALFTKVNKVIDEIGWDDWNKVFGTEDRAEAQDVIARSPKRAFQKFMRNIHRHSPMLGKYIRAVPSNASIIFYIAVSKISGVDMADIILKKYFLTKDETEK